MAASPLPPGPVPGAEGVASAPGREVVRSRLLAELLGGSVGVVEAGAGYGKSVLARQYQRELGVATAFVPVGPPDDDPALLMGSLRRSLATSRLSDLASATDVVDPATAVERLLDALAQLPVPLLVVLDDAHHLRQPQVTALVLRLARGLPAPHRLLITARRLAEALQPLRVLPAAAHLDTRALEFTELEGRGRANQPPAFFQSPAWLKTPVPTPMCSGCSSLCSCSVSKIGRYLTANPNSAKPIAMIISVMENSVHFGM